MKCKKFDECIQPHICGPSTACIWGMESEREEALALRDKELWNAAIEAAAKEILYWTDENYKAIILKLKK